MLKEAILNSPTYKPPLKWAGGKRWLVKHILPHWEKNKNKRLVEPLCGGLAVAIGLNPSIALLNDINPHLINFYKWLKKGLIINLSMQNNSNEYYTNRNKFNKLIEEHKENTKEAAELFYYLNKTGYNGLCRFNNSGKFNVPFGKYKKINYISDFKYYSKLFNKWTFNCMDFESLHLKDNDFIYADPPYDVDFTQYSKENFNWSEQIRLAEWLSKHNGIVLLSNQATKRIIDLYKNLGFELEFYSAPRMISCNGNRTPAKEVLAIRGL